MTVKTKVDWQRMQQLAEEAEHLIRERRWTEAEYDRINAEAAKAGGGEPGARDWLLHLAEPEWKEKRVTSELV
jgi:hypothetical protein